MCDPRAPATASRASLVPPGRVALLAGDCGPIPRAVRLLTLPSRARRSEDHARLPATPKPHCAALRNARMPRPFVCRGHNSSAFAAIDGRDPEPATPRTATAAALRVLLYAEAGSRSDLLGGGSDVLDEATIARIYEARRTIACIQPQRGALAASLHANDAPYAHHQTHIGSRPSVAFAALAIRGDHAGWTERERAAAGHDLPRGPARPFTLACLPVRDGHALIASCPPDAAHMLPIVFPVLTAPESERGRAATAHALALADHILIAPAVWDALSSTGRRGVTARAALRLDSTVPLPADALPDGRPADLFV